MLPLFSRPIHHTFAPLADASQRRAVLLRSYAPWRFVRGKSIEKLRLALALKFTATPFLFISGREALLAYCKTMGLRTGEEIIVQAYTCIVVPNAIHAAGGTVVYADVDPQTLNLDIDDVARKITPRTRAIVCQHTFGIPADTERLRALCDQHKLLLIEDCAHVLPDTQGPAAIGKHGDALLLSFGRDKAISGIAGGAMLCRRKEDLEAMQSMESAAQEVSAWTVQRLSEYPQIYAIARSFYGSGIGKVLLKLAAMLGFLMPILTADEKQGHMPLTLHKIPNLCAALALEQLKRLQDINDHRRSLTRFYLQACKDRGWKVPDGITVDLPLQKFPLFVKNPDAVRAALKKQNIHLDDGWTGCVICPRTASAEDAGYAAGCDPHAETVAKGILSLPTHPGMTEGDARRLMDALSPLLKQ